MSSDPVVTALALLAFVVATAGALALSGFVRVTRLRRLVERGAWLEAQDAAGVIETSWLRILPSIRRDVGYTLALCLHLHGDLRRSLAVLGRLEAESPRRPGHLLLEGGNLLLLGSDPERAVSLLEEACKVHQLPEDRLLLAIALQRVGRAAEAQAIVDAVGETRAHTAAWPKVNEPIFDYLRAVYLREHGSREHEPKSPELARSLRRAAEGELPTIYVTRAREELRAIERTSAEGDEGPTSLSPQVLG